MVSMSGAFRRLGLGALAAVATWSSIAQASAIDTRSLAERASTGDRLVFCHFMVYNGPPVNLGKHLT